MRQAIRARESIARDEPVPRNERRPTLKLLTRSAFTECGGRRFPPALQPHSGTKSGESCRLRTVQGVKAWSKENVRPASTASLDYTHCNSDQGGLGEANRRRKLVECTKSLDRVVTSSIIMKAPYRRELLQKTPYCPSAEPWTWSPSTPVTLLVVHPFAAPRAPRIS